MNLVYSNQFHIYLNQFNMYFNQFNIYLILISMNLFVNVSTMCIVNLVYSIRCNICNCTSSFSNFVHIVHNNVFHGVSCTHCT